MKNFKFSVNESVTYSDSSEDVSQNSSVEEEEDPETELFLPTKTFALKIISHREVIESSPKTLSSTYIRKIDIPPSSL